MEKWREGLVLFGLGGAGYVGLEYAWRGFSHPTMFLVGGLCFCLLSLIPREKPLWVQMALGAVVITVLEFVSGCVFNLYLGWNVWDYGLLWGNLLGQICVLYVVIWFWLSLPALWLNRAIRQAVSQKTPWF